MRCCAVLEEMGALGAAAQASRDGSDKCAINDKYRRICIVSAFVAQLVRASFRNATTRVRFLVVEISVIRGRTRAQDLIVVHGA